MRPEHSRTGGTQGDEAARWAAHLRLGDLAPSERARLETWLSRPGAARALAETTDTLRRVEALADAPEMRRLRAAALHRRPADDRTSWRIAAAIGVVAVLWGVQALAPRRGDAERSRGGPAAAQAVQRWSSPVGGRVTARLADGSYAELNTDSAIEVAYGPARREVRLLRGEVLFKVAKNRLRPFAVTAGDRTVTAVGTAFEVRLDPSRMSVVLLEGKVAVEPARAGPLARLGLHPGRRMLKPGDRLVSSGTGDTVREVDLAQATSWREGRLILRDEPLAEAVRELNRYNVRKVVVAEPDVGALRVSGVFDVAEPDAFVAGATTLYPLQAVSAGRDVVELRRRRVGQGVAPVEERPRSGL